MIRHHMSLLQATLSIKTVLSVFTSEIEKTLSDAPNNVKGMERFNIIQKNVETLKLIKLPTIEANLAFIPVTFNEITQKRPLSRNQILSNIERMLYGCLSATIEHPEICGYYETAVTELNNVCFPPLFYKGEDNVVYQVS